MQGLRPPHLRPHPHHHPGERRRADGAELAASAAASSAAADRAERAEGAKARDSAEAVGRQQAEAKAAALQRQLTEALRVCEVAKGECARVRKRNEELEAELAAVVAGSEGNGAPRPGLSRVFEQIDEMETMLDAGKQREAERRLRERARRAQAHEVEARLPP